MQFTDPDGKYSVTFNEDNGKLSATRYEEEWIPTWESGAGAVIALMYEIDRLRKLCDKPKEDPKRRTAISFVLERIKSFEAECAQGGSTDTGDAWDLLNVIEAELTNADLEPLEEYATRMAASKSGCSLEWMSNEYLKALANLKREIEIGEDHE
jgi:hypothetical protein